MKALLLDTQSFLWWREGNSRLGRKARAAIERDASEVRISTASAWELAIKVRSGRLPFRERLAVWLPAAIHGSGFIENLTVVTSDTVFDDHDVKVLDARR